MLNQALCGKRASVLARWRRLRVLIRTPGERAQCDLSSIFLCLFYEGSIVPETSRVMSPVDHSNGRPGCAAACAYISVECFRGQKLRYLYDQRRLDTQSLQAVWPGSGL